MQISSEVANAATSYAMSVIESKTFNYEGNPITFNRGDAVMVSATEMAKPFGKKRILTRHANNPNNECYKKGIKSRKLNNSWNAERCVSQLFNGIVIATFPSMSEASRETGIKSSHISECCRGKRKQAGGFCWDYANDDSHSTTVSATTAHCHNSQK